MAPELSERARADRRPPTSTASASCSTRCSPAGRRSTRRTRWRCCVRTSRKPCADRRAAERGRGGARVAAGEGTPADRPASAAEARAWLEAARASRRRPGPARRAAGAVHADPYATTVPDLGETRLGSRRSNPPRDGGSTPADAGADPGATRTSAAACRAGCYVGSGRRRSRDPVVGGDRVRGAASRRGHQGRGRPPPPHGPEHQRDERRVDDDRHEGTKVTKVTTAALTSCRTDSGRRVVLRRHRRERPPLRRLALHRERRHPRQTRHLGPLVTATAPTPGARASTRRAPPVGRRRDPRRRHVSQVRRGRQGHLHEVLRRRPRPERRVRHLVRVVPEGAVERAPAAAPRRTATMCVTAMRSHAL